MRSALSAFLLILLALTALAGTGCKRPQSGQSTQWAQLAQMAAFSRTAHAAMTPAAQPQHLAGAAQARDPRHPVHEQVTFVFCHPRADQWADASLSAAAAQVVFDLQANNDDRTEMIAAEFPRAAVDRLPQTLADGKRPADASVWLAILLRPPRPSPQTA